MHERHSLSNAKKFSGNICLQRHPLCTSFRQKSKPLKAILRTWYSHLRHYGQGKSARRYCSTQEGSLYYPVRILLRRHTFCSYVRGDFFLSKCEPTPLSNLPWFCAAESIILIRISSFFKKRAKYYYI